MIEAEHQKEDSLYYTKGEWGKSSLHKDLRKILRELVYKIIEIRERKNQPEFNKGLDAICDYDETIIKILNRTAAPDMYEALKALLFQFAAAIEHPYSKDKEVYEQAKKALAKADGK